MVQYTYFTLLTSLRFPRRTLLPCTSTTLLIRNATSSQNPILPPSLFEKRKNGTEQRQLAMTQSSDPKVSAMDDRCFTLENDDSPVSLPPLDPPVTS